MPGGGLNLVRQPTAVLRSLAGFGMRLDEPVSPHEVPKDGRRNS
nr:MAG TPA: hypothetical protein [Caudoviricetes sp.]